MQWILALLLVVLTSCTQDTLERFCPYECWAVPGVTEGIIGARPDESKIGVGQCRAGVPTCDKDFNIIECNGEVLPDPETCDNIDNDCDGGVDEEWKGMPLTRYGDNGCLNPGVCLHTWADCIHGKWVCRYPDDYEPGSETSCDNKDNDCDGRVDENLFINDFCYEVPPELWYTATNPPCHPGVYQCVQGEKVCTSQVLPSAELCDHIDNDCNGIIDDVGETLDANYDIVFIIDNSGSMRDEIEAVGTALSTYVEQFEDNEHFRFALVLMTHAPSPKVVTDVPFGDLAAIQNRLLSMECNGSAAEASLDSMDIVCNIENPLELEWRENANRLFFAFTDEPARSYSNPLTTAQNVIDKCLESWTLPFIWAKTLPDFEHICLNSNGRYFPLSNYWETIFDDLNSIILSLCIPTQ